MIFDFYLSYNTNQKYAKHKPAFRFSEQEMYVGIKGNEISGSLVNGYFCCLHRSDYNNSFAEVDGKKLWIFGSVFTNRKYATQKERIPYRIFAYELLQLYLIENEKLTEKIKGSFVIITLDEKSQQVSLISDRHNLLPLYFSFEEGALVVSSNIMAIIKTPGISRTLNEQAMTEQMLFDYILDDRTFFKDIKRIKSASVYKFSDDSLVSYPYWDVSQLYNEKLLDKTKSLDLLGEMLHESVNLYSLDAEKVLLSLTGGFDGRANLALLDRPASEFLCYSYGMPGSKQISVPQEIASKTGIKYKPVILETDFLNRYSHYSEIATYFSNGTAPIGFCNIPYAFEQLSAFSDTVVTGLLGSEILRPLHNLGIQINDNSCEIFLSEDYIKAIDIVVKRSIDKNLIDPKILIQSTDSIKKYFAENYFEKYKDYDKLTRFFFFILNEGMRKYFSQEIQIERVFVTTRVPYFDNDMVDLMYKTPFAGMYNGFLGKSKFKRRKGQLLYANVIKKYKPQLGKIMLDRGYTPDDLLLPFPFNYMKISLGVFKAKKHMQKAGGNDTFKTEIWADDTLRRSVEKINKISDQLFRTRLKDTYRDRAHLNSFLTYRHLVSLHDFFGHI